MILLKKISKIGEKIKMKLLNTKLKYYLLLILPLLLVACDNNNPAAPPAPVTLTSVQVSVDETTSLPVGYMRQYKATGNYSDNSQQDLTSTVAWSSSTASATISAAGVAAAVSVGSTEISASSTGVTSPSITLDVSNATFTGLVIERLQNSVDLPFNRYEQMYAFVTFSDNTAIDVTEFADWTSSLTGVITVNNILSSPSRGEILAVANAGNSVITATDPSNGANMAMTTVNVSGATLTEVLVTPSTEVTLPKGVVQEYTAQGLFSDSVTRGIDKSRITWWYNKSDGIARFTADAELTAVKVGSTSINVVDEATLIFKTLPVSVTDAELVAIVTVPVGGAPGSSVQIPKGTNVEYSAYSVFTDASFRDVTNNTTFTSSDTSTALPISSRKFQGKAIGNVTITALDRDTGKEAKPVGLEVTSAVLETMMMEPIAPAAIHPGDQIQFAVRGAFTDGTSKDLTKTAQWFTDNTAVDVSQIGETKGLATARAVGSANIKAVSEDGLIETSVLVTVTP